MDQWKGLSPRYVSKVDYEATSEDEISFKASERFQLLWVSGYRWLVTKVDEDKKDLKKIGYVPAINLVKEKSVEEQPWYLDVDRNKAEELLMTDPNRVGSFVVRPSQGNILGYALSVRRDSGVIHFCIKWDQEHQFFIEDLKSFVCVHDLISYLREKWMVRDCLELKPYIKVAIKEDFWEKLWSDFAVTEQLSSSHFKGKWIAKNIPVHIQSIDKEMFELQDFMTGIEILKRLNHKNIIHLHAVCTTGDTVFTVTEFLEKGNLKKFLKGEEGPFLTVPQLMHIASQVVDGLAYLEVKRVAHFSLASCNVIVGNNLICKISNFGYARIIKVGLNSFSKFRFKTSNFYVSLYRDLRFQVSFRENY
ncbi:tyrosine-protein kinase Srms-like [Phyllobates terribilis]|uniref:tyrosine-protein kinase Srms-like n=1 Tax=Phyllobates terribilis TaxID=111132 RepID=UPI003CCA73D4